MTDADIPAHLQPVRYDIRCKCLLCGNIYSKRVGERVHMEIVTGKRLDPPCPRKACKEKVRAAEIERMAERMAKIIIDGKGPGQVGSNFSKAADATAAMVMKDYNLTDLRDDNRPGESSTPKLPTAQQERADAFFGTSQKVVNPFLQAQLQRATMAARSGALAPQSHNAIDRVLGAKHRVPVKILNRG